MNDITKKTIDYSVKCIPQNEQTREDEQNTIKNNSLPSKQNKSLSQNN